MNSRSKDAARTIATSGAVPRRARRPRRRLRWLRVAAAGVFGLNVVIGCNAVLGIDEATLCSGSCDGGVPSSIDRGAPADLPDEGAGGARPNGADASVPLGNGELGAPTRVELVPSAESPDDSGSGNAGSSNGSGGGDPANETPDDGNSGNGNPGNGNSGNGNPGNGNSGNGNPGNGNSGSGGGSAGEQPPPSACTGRDEGTAFCDGATRIACGVGGTVTSTLLCASAEHCSEGTGATCAMCRTGEALCNGAALATCNAAHTGYDVQTCASPDLCNALQARCETTACEVGQMRCDGALLQTCNAALTGFETIADCLSAAACNLETLSCNVCTPNAKRCVDSGTTATCAADGQSEVFDECIDLLEECTSGVCELTLF
jgi:hypothetical protein